MISAIRQIYPRPQSWPHIPGCRTDGVVLDSDMDGAATMYTETWKTILVNVGLTHQRNMLNELHGLPYPIAYRNQGTVDGWRRAMHSTVLAREFWRLFEKESCTATFCIAPLNAYLESFFAPAPGSEEAARWSGMAANMAVQVGVNIMFECKRGAIIESTPALETLLTHSDLDVALPMGMFAPPFAAQYLHFGAEAAKALRCPGCDDNDVVFDGVFCFLSQSPDHPGDASERKLELIFISRHNDHCVGYSMLRAPVGASDRPVVDWVDAIFEKNGGKRHEGVERQRLLEAVNFVVKLFLYMGLKNVRQAVETPHTQALKKLEQIGPKKRAKAGRQIKSLYDRITVGPTALSATLGAHSPGHGKAPHWRRGHFRMQIHGPGRLERKLIFVAPMMVRADKLTDDLPHPKTYRGAV
jgi:hypothetical protein